eukprot:2618005-Rhodomonas_salina.1
MMKSFHWHRHVKAHSAMTRAPGHCEFMCIKPREGTRRIIEVHSPPPPRGPRQGAGERRVSLRLALSQPQHHFLSDPHESTASTRTAPSLPRPASAQASAPPPSRHQSHCGSSQGESGTCRHQRGAQPPDTQCHFV